MNQKEFESKVDQIIKDYSVCTVAIKNACAAIYDWDCLADIVDAVSLNIPLDVDDLQKQLDILESSVEGILSEYS